MEDELMQIIPAESVFFEDYPMAKVFAEVSIRNVSSEKIVFRVFFIR